MTTAERCIGQCQQWVESFIRHHSICPFADRVIREKQLEYRCLADQDLESALTELFMILGDMRTSPSPETMIVILPAWQEDFDDFLRLTELARALLDEYELGATFQFANFHPDYLFADEALDSSSHYTNRAPWPILHILRQDSISKALAHYPEPEKIPERNIELMQAIGKESLQANLAKIMNSDVA